MLIIRECRQTHKPCESGQECKDEGYCTGIVSRRPRLLPKPKLGRPLQQQMARFRSRLVYGNDAVWREHSQVCWDARFLCQSQCNSYNNFTYSLNIKHESMSSALPLTLACRSFKGNNRSP